MIRKFVQCKNTQERMELLAATNITDWTESNLNTIIEILGMTVPEDATKEDKWELIIMSLKAKDAAEIANLSRKVFADVKDEDVESADKEFKNLSDMAAYLMICGGNVAEA